MKAVILTLAYMTLIIFGPFVIGYIAGAIIGTAKMISNQIYEQPEKGGNYSVIFRDKKKEAEQ